MNLGEVQAADGLADQLADRPVRRCATPQAAFRTCERAALGGVFLLLYS